MFVLVIVIVMKNEKHYSGLFAVEVIVVFFVLLFVFALLFCWSVRNVVLFCI